MPTPEADVREKHRQAIKSEIKSMRDWLDYLERDIENDKGVIHVLIILSISESCTKLIYSAGIANGAELNKE